MIMKKWLSFVMACTFVVIVSSDMHHHHRRRKNFHRLLAVTTTTTEAPPSHFSIVIGPTKPPQKNLLIALDSITPAATLGKEYDYTTTSAPVSWREPTPTPPPNYIGGLGPFSSDSFNKYYSSNNGLYSNDLGNGAGYWGGGAPSSNYNNGNKDNGYRNNGPMVESKYSYDNMYDRDYSMSYDSGSYDYGGGSMIGSIGSYLSYIIMDPGSILMAAAALSLKALVLNLVLVATNRTGRRRKRSGDHSFDFGSEDGSMEVVDHIIETLQITLDAPEKCRARMFCEAGRRIQNGIVSRSGNVASIVRYFGTKMEDTAYLSSSSFSKNRSQHRRNCDEDFLECPDQMRKLNQKFAKISRYLPYIDLIPVNDNHHNQGGSLLEEPT